MSETVLKLDNVNLTLGSGATQVHVLKGVSIALEKGESVGIVGPSGSGKTSLLMVLSGLERADSGSIKVNGTELTKLSEDALARFRGRSIGIVFQTASPFDTPRLMTELIAWVNQERETARLHPLLIVALCVVVVWQIWHPEDDLVRTGAGSVASGPNGCGAGSVASGPNDYGAGSGVRFDDPAGGVLDGATDRMGKWSRRRARQVVEAWPVPVDPIAPENSLSGPSVE